jgi:hypothetical protein
MIVESIKRIHIKENSWLAKIAAYKLGVDGVALTIGTTIHLHNASRQLFLGNEPWVRHELKHVEQFSKHGFIKFIAMYLVESVRKGYYNNRFEIEAREAEAVVAGS